MSGAGYKSILFFCIAAFLGAFGQYLYKTGAGQISANIFSWFTNFRILSGILCYIAVMFLFIIAFKIGGNLTVLYPVYATTFIWALLIGVFLLGEKIKLIQIIGIALIILGIYLVTR